MREPMTEEYRVNTRLKVSKEVSVWLESLNKNRRLGKMLSTILQNVYESEHKEELLGEFSSITNDFEKEYKSNYNSQITDMLDKVDKIEDMAKHLKALALVGNRLELEGRATNIEISTYILNRQITNLCDTLGITVEEFKRNKDKESSVLDIVDLVIDSYGSMLSSLKVEIPTQIIKPEVINLGDLPKEDISANNSKEDIEDKEEEIDLSIIDGFM